MGMANLRVGPTAGGCEAATVGAGKVAISDAGAGSIRLGTVIRQASSVTAVLDGGRRVPGAVQRAAGQAQAGRLAGL
jgi:hypothetical protein